MSGHSTSCHVSPRPLEPHFALPNRVLVEGQYGVQLPTPHPQASRSCEGLLFFMFIGAASKSLSGAGSPAGAILLSALRPRAALALAFPPDFVSGRGPLLRVIRRAHFFSEHNSFFSSEIMSLNIGIICGISFDSIMEYSMSQKRGQVPVHIQLKTFDHPGKDTPLIRILEGVNDPRSPSCNTQHSIVTILFIIFTTVLCGASNWEEIYHTAEGMRDWLNTYVNLSCGIPSKWTLERVLSLIPTRHLQPLLVQFLEEIKMHGTVAIDGKTLRGTKAWNDKHHPLHLLHAWSVE